MLPICANQKTKCLNKINDALKLYALGHLPKQLMQRSDTFGRKHHQISYLMLCYFFILYMNCGLFLTSHYAPCHLYYALKNLHIIKPVRAYKNHIKLLENPDKPSAALVEPSDIVICGNCPSIHSMSLVCCGLTKSSIKCLKAWHVLDDFKDIRSTMCLDNAYCKKILKTPPNHRSFSDVSTLSTIIHHDPNVNAELLMVWLKQDTNVESLIKYLPLHPYKMIENESFHDNILFINFIKNLIPDKNLPISRTPHHNLSLMPSIIDYDHGRELIP